MKKTRVLKRQRKAQRTNAMVLRSLREGSAYGDYVGLPIQWVEDPLTGQLRKVRPGVPFVRAEPKGPFYTT